jgi:hypothetical protein
VSLAGHDPSYLRILWAVASAIGGMICIALGLVFRRAKTKAEAEEVDRILAEDDASASRRHHVSERHG